VSLDEVFEALNLRRTHRLEPFPVILLGSRYWSGLRDWLREAAVAEGMLGPEDLDLLEIMDDPEAVVRRVRQCHSDLCRNLGLGDDEVP
jgi:predicted Rossmann-fold nucleotide-binding protein